jgi:hypothetical protein
MSTKRVPIKRTARAQISDAALDAFQTMQQLEHRCECPERDWAGDYSNFAECRACDTWWEQHGILHRELRLPPWQYPAVEHPDAENPWPAWANAAARWQPDREAQARYRELEKAVAERRAADELAADDKTLIKPSQQSRTPHRAGPKAFRSSSMKPRRRIHCRRGGSSCNSRKATASKSISLASSR